MARRIKRFFVFLFFSLFFSMTSGKVSQPSQGEKKDRKVSTQNSFSINSAQAGWCCSRGPYC